VARARYKKEVSPTEGSRGQGSLQRGGSPDRGVERPGEVITNLACKLRRLLVFVGAWLSSWSCGHVATGVDVLLLCWPWQHCSHGDGSSAVLCNAASVMVFAVISRFSGASYSQWVAALGRCSPGRLVGLRIMTPIIEVRALRQLGRSLGRDLCHGSHPIVGGIIHVSYQSVFGRWVLYPLSPLVRCCLVIAAWHRMASDRTEVTAVRGSMLDLSMSCPGVVSGERSRVFRVAKAGEGIVADPDLGVGLACLS
jgi:hypothetical protein